MLSDVRSYDQKYSWLEPLVTTKTTIYIHVLYVLHKSFFVLVYLVHFLNSLTNLLTDSFIHFSSATVQKFQGHSTSTTSKSPSVMSCDNPVSPMDTKNSISFFVKFFWVSLEF